MAQKKFQQVTDEKEEVQLKETLEMKLPEDNVFNMESKVKSNKTEKNDSVSMETHPKFSKFSKFKK